jgi:hypothetical protein
VSPLSASGHAEPAVPSRPATVFLYAVPLLRYFSQGAYTKHRALMQTVVAMRGGSVIGALIEGLLVGTVPASLLKMSWGLS